MRFLSRLSDSISDFVSGSEADEVTGFVGRERLRLYSKNCFNVMAVVRIPTIVTAHTDERDRCSVRASVVFRV